MYYHQRQPFMGWYVYATTLEEMRRVSYIVSEVAERRSCIQNMQDAMEDWALGRSWEVLHVVFGDD